MLLHAPRKTAINDAIPRLAAVRAPPEPIMFSPKRIRRRIRPTAKRKNPDLATTSCKVRRHADMVSQASYMSLTNALISVCLTGSLQGHIAQSPYWHSKHLIASIPE